MMKTATVTTLKAKLSAHLALVKRGEEVLVTERGKAVARIVPIRPNEAEDERIRDLIARGLVKPGHGAIRPLLEGIPICRVPEGTMLRILDEEREDRV